MSLATVLIYAPGRAPAALTVEVKADPVGRAQGYMGRRVVPTDRGMLFVYPTRNTITFWMENTLIPLDLVFIDDTGTVVGLVQGMQPGSQRLARSNVPVRFAIEVPQGMALQWGLVPGAVLDLSRVTDVPT